MFFGWRKRLAKKDFVMQTKLKYEIVLKRVNLFQDIDEEKRCQLFAFNICVRNISSFLSILRVTSQLLKKSWVSPSISFQLYLFDR